MSGAAGPSPRLSPSAALDLALERPYVTRRKPRTMRVFPIVFTKAWCMILSKS
jgi:hypothetical protein